MNIAILGSGAFGTALAIALARDGRDVTLWGRSKEALALMESSRRSEKLPDILLPDGLKIEADLSVAARSDILLIATPMQSLRHLLPRLPDLAPRVPVVSCCKGLDLQSHTGPSRLIADMRPDQTPAVLTGPSFAHDIARGLPTALTLACGSKTMGERLQQALSTQSLRLYRSTDMIGAELGGALKNVVAIACGVCIGAGLGDSARAALMTRGFAEMQKLAAHLGGQPETLTGLSGLGDLALTCNSELSRNFRFGLALGRDESFDPSVTVEGAATAQAVSDLANDIGLDLPICAAVRDIARGGARIEDIMTRLLTRPLRSE